MPRNMTFEQAKKIIESNPNSIELLNDCSEEQKTSFIKLVAQLANIFDSVEELDAVLDRYNETKKSPSISLAGER